MHKNVKRALAIAAVAPLAFAGGTGSASAAVIFFPNPTQVGNVLTADCDHPDFPGGELRVRAVVTLEGDGTGRDRNDIERVRVFATDNGGSGSFDDNTAHVEKVRLRYFHEDDFALFGPFFQPKAAYSKTHSGNGFTSDGRQTFDKEKDNVNVIEVKVTWSEAGIPADDETVDCFIPIGFIS